MFSKNKINKIKKQREARQIGYDDGDICRVINSITDKL